VFLKNKNYDEEVDPQQESVRIKSYQVLSKSIFERLYEALPKVFLAKQYRMHPLLVEFLNQTIYPGLVCDTLVYDYKYTSSLFGQALIFIDHNHPEEKNYVSEEFSPSRAEYTNDEEVRIAEKLVRKYIDSGVAPLDIGVISPYNAQVRKLNKVLEPLQVAAKTVDCFQGQEKKVILLSLVRSNEHKTATERLGFLVDERRFNVAITRFKYELIIIGNADTLSAFGEYYDLYDGRKKPIYYGQLIRFIKEKGLYIEEIDKYLAKKVQFIEASRLFVDRVNEKMQQELVKRISAQNKD
jgi:superfamily I DNA and/or RNA helicase